jgi:hypothetical protein
VAAAVLTQLAAGSLADECSEIDRRVKAMLSDGFPPNIARNLRVHIYQLGPRVKG